jgi:hypothetical protein
MNAESNDQQFTDLLAYNKVDMGRSNSAQNVIKSDHVVKNGVQQVSLPTGDSDEPTLLIHREGDQIVSVEFQCKCGRSASVRLEYDEE